MPKNVYHIYSKIVQLIALKEHDIFEIWQTNYTNYINSLTEIHLYSKGVVVNIGHMLGLDQEREELGRKHVSYRYGDPFFEYVCLFVCMYYYSIVNH